jgi:NTP pyrophosphatase (non-canonical NTP hydrolase)
MRVKEELADVFIYTLCMANQMHVDIARAVSEKIKKNERKYPVDEVLRTGRYRKDKSRKKD